MGQAPQNVTLTEPFRMWRGGMLSNVTLAYETWGTLREDNLVLLFTGLSPSAHAAASAADPSRGWWEGIVGPGKAIDTTRWFVVCVNSLGSCFGSTGPSSVAPETGLTYQLDFPALSVEDIAEAGRRLLRALEWPEPHLVVGPSLGGMSALAFALMHPDATRNLLLVSSALHAHPFAIAIRSLQREVIRSDPAWQGGYYRPGHEPVSGMRLARKLGMMSYRSPEEWLKRFNRDRVRNDVPSGAACFGIDFQVESYLEAHAEKFVGKFDANCYLYLSHAMDLFDTADHGNGDINEACRRLLLNKVRIISVDTDILFPPSQQDELAKALRDNTEADVQVCALPSIQGHDSFLVDMERFGPAIGNFLEQL